MIDQSTKEAIKIIKERLAKHKIKWALVGTTNMKLQGMKTNPHDLDVIVQYKDLKTTSEIFSDYSSSPVIKLKSLTDQPVWEVQAKINSINIQIIGGGNDDVYVSKLLADKITFINLDENEVPCFTLEAEAQAYSETNRNNKANLIKEYLIQFC